MAIVNLDFYSYELAMNTQAAVLLPEKRGVPCRSREGEPYPVLYLLHGHGQDFTSWTRFTRLESYLQNSDVIVVMPNGSRGCYVDGLHTHRYGTYLTEELPRILKNWFRISDHREDTFIAGMSMGGYGALRAALAHPETYAAAVGMSSVIRMGWTSLRGHADKGLAIPEEPEIDGNFHAIFGEDETGYEASDYSLRHLAELVEAGDGPRPRLLQLCGDEDPLTSGCREFDAFLTGRCPSIPHEFHVGSGIHNFDFWDAQLPKALEFLGLL